MQEEKEKKANEGKTLESHTQILEMIMNKILFDFGGKTKKNTTLIVFM